MRTRRGGTGEEGGGLPSAPSPLTQIVPNLASIYSVFHSVNYNSVIFSYNSPLFIQYMVQKKIEIYLVPETWGYLFECVSE